MAKLDINMPLDFVLFTLQIHWKFLGYIDGVRNILWMFGYHLEVAYLLSVLTNLQMLCYGFNFCFLVFQILSII